MSGDFWSEREIDILRQLYPDALWVKIRRALPSRTMAACHAMAQVQKIKRLRRGKTFWTGAEKQMLKRLWPSASWEEPMISLGKYLSGHISTPTFRGSTPTPTPKLPTRKWRRSLKHYREIWSQPLLRFFRRLGSIFGKQWVNQARAINHYWQIYGGPKALLLSPYLHVSLVLTFLCFHFWSSKTTASEIAVSVLPNLLGFTVGALAIVLAFSSAPVFETLAEKGEPQSFYMKLTASLIHFILVQVLALVAAIVARITESTGVDVLALFLLFYAVLVTFAAGIQLFLTAIVYNARASVDGKKKTEPDGQR